MAVRGSGSLDLWIKKTAYESGFPARRRRPKNSNLEAAIKAKCNSYLCTFRAIDALDLLNSVRLMGFGT